MILDPYRFASAASYYGNTRLQLHCNGSNGSTTFTDSSAYGHAMTATSGAVITTAQSKFGGASGDFTANNGSRVVSASSPDLKLAGEFCVELFWRPASTAAGIYFVGCLNNTYFWFVTDSSDKVTAYVLGSTVLSTATFSTGTWYHLAATRDSSNVVRFFVDGVLQGFITSTNEMTNDCSWQVGTAADLAGPSSGGRCQIDEFRIVVGAAVYTADFTPPSAPFADA